MEPTVIEHLQLISNNKGHDVVMKTLLEHNQSAYTTIAILEGVDGFKLIMKVKNIFKGDMLVGTIRP